MAELIGYYLAGQVGVAVPDYAVGRFENDGPCWFASCLVEDGMRDVEPFIRTGRIGNFSMLSHTIVLDILLANNDRNLGNFIGRPNNSAGTGHVDLVAIDFEKSLTVRSKAPLVEIPTLKRGALWPREHLGKLISGRCPLTKETTNSVKSMPPVQFRNAVSACFAAMRVDDKPHEDQIVDVLVKRQADIDTLTRLEWN